MATKKELSPSIDSEGIAPAVPCLEHDWVKAKGLDIERCSKCSMPKTAE